MTSSSTEAHISSPATEVQKNLGHNRFPRTNSRLPLKPSNTIRSSTKERRRSVNPGSRQSSFEINSAIWTPDQAGPEAAAAAAIDEKEHALLLRRQRRESRTTRRNGDGGDLRNRGQQADSNHDGPADDPVEHFKEREHLDSFDPYSRDPTRSFGDVLDSSEEFLECLSFGLLGSVWSRFPPAFLNLMSTLFEMKINAFSQPLNSVTITLQTKTNVSTKQTFHISYFLRGFRLKHVYRNERRRDSLFQLKFLAIFSG